MLGHVVTAAVLALVVLALVVVGCGRSSDRFTGSARTAGHAVTLTLDPAATGATVASVDVTTADGTPVARDVQLVAVMADMGHTVPPVTVPADGPPGHHRFAGELFFMSGAWDVDVAVDGPAGREVATFRVLVGT